jgi:hypothetical protein
MQLRRETISGPVTCFCNHTDNKRDAVMNSPTDDSEQIDHKTSRSICHAVGERLQQHLRPQEAGLPPHLAHLLDELRKQDDSGHPTRPN